MPVTSVTTDRDALTMAVVADFAVPRRRLWDAYADPRRIERFWGPVGWPATFTRHDLAPDGRSNYVMTGPDGERSAGFWEFATVDPPHSFEVVDGFAAEDGSPDTAMPTMRMTFAFEETAAGSRLVTTTTFPSPAALEQVLGMGMEEGLRSAMSQIDDVVADLATFAPGRGTWLQELSDTVVRVSRVVRAAPEPVWAAHHEPDLLRRWMLGPDGWTMPVCEPATRVGGTYRYEWVDAEGGNRFGFTGELLETHPPHRSVTTERMIGVEGPGTVNELTLTPLGDGTLVTLVITYPDRDLRDTVLATGMIDGMETSYARLEEILGAA